MRIYVKTRGTSVDYRFLGAVPGSRWWEGLSGRYLTEEKPAVAVRGDGRGWSAAMFGIPSSRRDSRPRAIRYSLLIEAGAHDAKLAAQWVRLALDDAARADLGARLDEIYPADLVDAALETPAEASLPHAELVLAIVREATAGLPGEVPAWPVRNVTAPWAGPAAQPEAVQAFLAHTGRLARGEPGLCFTSGSLATIEQARRAAARIGGEVGILVLGAQFDAVRSLAQPKDPSPNANAYRAVAARLTGNADGSGFSSRLAARAAASLGLGVTALVMFVWLLRKT